MQADRVTYIGHATTLIEVGGTRVLTDPVLRPHVGHIRRIAAPVTQDLEADAMLLSHAHHDHLDFRRLRLCQPVHPRSRHPTWPASCGVGRDAMWARRTDPAGPGGVEIEQ